MLLIFIACSPTCYLLSSSLLRRLFYPLHYETEIGPAAVLGSIRCLAAVIYTSGLNRGGIAPGAPD